PAMRSRALKPSRILAFELGSRRLAVYRDDAGGVHAVDARCPHLGADLSKGTVEIDAIPFAFHHLAFATDGACPDAPRHPQPPGRRTGVYPACEGWGFVWVFTGPRALFDLPRPAGGDWRAMTLPSQRIDCHPHLALGNGLDLTHYETLHGMRFSEPPRLTVT